MAGDDRMRDTRPHSTVVALWLVGCGPFVDMAADGESTDAETSTTAVPDDDDPEIPDREPQAESGGGDGDGGPPPDTVGFIQDPDGGGLSWECDLWAQDCPAGEKCNMWANDGGGAWNATKCVPIDPDADAIGEPCHVVDGVASGFDSCVLGALCWNVDPDTGLGVCVGYCEGSEANPTCADPNAHCTGRDVTLCLPSCCPLLQDCHEGEACYPVNDRFECVPDAGGDAGAFGEACEYINVCDPGLFCATPEAVPSCDGSIGCCSAFCDTSDPQASANCPGAGDGQQCVPWFEEGQAPPGEENVGACMVPP